MANSVLILTIFTTIIAFASGDRFPVGFSPCPKSDIGQEVCLRNNAQRFVTFLGTDNTDIKNFVKIEPLGLTDFDFNQNGVYGSLKNTQVTGLKDAVITSFTLNWAEKRGHLAFNVPILGFVGNYVVDGLIAALKIVSQAGLCEVKMSNVNVAVDFDIEETTGGDGQLYMKFVNPSTTFVVVDNAEFLEHTHGLFDLFAKAVLEALSLGWSLFVGNTFGPFFNILSETVIAVLNGYFAQVSENELFIF